MSAEETLSTILLNGSRMKASMLIRSASFHSVSSIGSGSDSPSAVTLLRSRSVGLRPIRSVIHLDATKAAAPPVRRARSDSDLVLSDRTGGVTWSPPPTVEEEEDEVELESAGGGIGKGKKIGGGGRGGGRGGNGGGELNDNGRIGTYYQEMLRSDPWNPLLLRNYGKYLHEVKGDAKGAEECYGRAILSSPGDGDVLSLYGSLVWETHRDEERASSYFERAVEASPDDCYVLGSYASFLWDTE